jgi:hypothetical protein
MTPWVGSGGGELMKISVALAALATTLVVCLAQVNAYGQ